jgi:hypothetical protein
MKVFASNYIEPLIGEQVEPVLTWSWKPSNSNIDRIYASGNKTATRSSTYSTEKDNETDSDRPNEGK